MTIVGVLQLPRGCIVMLAAREGSEASTAFHSWNGRGVFLEEFEQTVHGTIACVGTSEEGGAVDVDLPTLEGHVPYISPLPLR